eukprot:CAMPEP_0202697430 /NCGR_PEP_ID=MMETSP1385-20130828/10766_1 /ASSEMBLY_ACC=CAM_ASM_000861 /TAXON_ID=933848 /ORGANISM="Elphidium margaritaceum" /LENGTH=283 /DNA_ID=CAMNT_0049353891 /DNA_START=54 /DNA_END=902 /DNA_ORIENTATION=-
MLEPVTLLVLGAALKSFLAIRECKHFRTHCQTNSEANHALCEIDRELYALEMWAWCTVQSQCGSLTLNLDQQSKFEEWYKDPQFLQTAKKQKFIALYHEGTDKLSAIEYLKNQTLHKMEQTPSMFEFSHWDARRPRIDQQSFFDLDADKRVIASYFDVLYRLMQFDVTSEEINQHLWKHPPSVKCELTQPPNIGQQTFREQLEKMRAQLQKQKEQETEKEKQAATQTIGVVVMVVLLILLCGLCGVCLGAVCGAAVSFFGLPLKIYPSRDYMYRILYIDTASV